MDKSFCIKPEEHIKYHTTGCLIKAFRLAGSSLSYRTLLRHEAKGNLKFSRSPTDFKKLGGYSLGKKLGAVRYMTAEEIQEIVKTFLPGGKGLWNYEDHDYRKESIPKVTQKKLLIRLKIAQDHLNKIIKTIENSGSDIV